jgi:hypothetical protein
MSSGHASALWFRIAFWTRLVKEGIVVVGKVVNSSGSTESAGCTSNPDLLSRVAQANFQLKTLVEKKVVIPKTNCGVFGPLMQRNGQKCDKKQPMGKHDRKKFCFSTFSAKSF